MVHKIPEGILETFILNPHHIQEDDAFSYTSHIFRKEKKMYYITSYNRFGQKYTSEKEERPNLQGNPNLDLNQLNFWDRPAFNTRRRNIPNI